MTSIREVIRAIIQDDALYKRRDLPGDLDEPKPSSCEKSCACQSCSQNDDFVTPKHALYSMIGDAISIYDDMEGDRFHDDEKNESIIRIAERIRSMKG